MAFEQTWRVTLLLLLTAAGSYAWDCKDIDRSKCFCFENTDIQCPNENPQFTIFVNKKNAITLQCMNTFPSYIDLDNIPEINVSNSRSFNMQYCYLNTSFMNILKKFSVHNLNSLSFEPLGSENDKFIIRLSKESFQSLQNLETLNLGYNKYYLTEDFLANTPNLLTFVLRKSYLGNLEKYFKYVPKLSMLQLTNNKISSLPDGIFEGLSNLTKLLIFGNNITTFSKNTFKNLRNLQLLEISSNNIQELPEDIFAELPKLVNISLRGNQITYVHRNLFINNTRLENIRLGGNINLILADYIFANLKFLRNVELFQNLLETVPENIFVNCENLEVITFQYNRLTSLPAKLFKGLKTLKTLDLSRNKLTLLPDEVFSSLEKLEVLNLSNNRLSEITGYLFENLESLQNLDLHNNIISVIDAKAFTGLEKSLTYLDLSYNDWNNSYEVPHLDISLTPLRSPLFLEKLVLNHNKIKKIPALTTLLSLHHLDLSYNQIDSLPIYIYAQSSRITLEIDLSHNNIEQIDFRYAEAISRVNSALFEAEHSNSGSIILKLDNNPIVCDCRNFDLFLYNNFEMKKLKTFVNINQDGLLCSDNSSKVSDLRPKDIDCFVINGCPDSCECIYRPLYRAIVVDCSFQNMSTYPVIDFQTKEHSFNQTYLILTGNRLTSGPSNYMMNYANITVLDLSANYIPEVNWVPPAIRELNLSYNLIKNLDSNFINKLKNATSLQTLDLKGNPWDCNCESLEMQEFLLDYFHKVNLSEVFCENIQTQLIIATDICSSSPYLTIMLPVILSVGLFFAAACAFYYRYQTEIKIYLFAKNMCLWFVTEEELDKEKTYDVFVSYASQDEKFVLDHLLPELENGEVPFKVCIHIRDWIPGEFISSQVINSVKDSRRTLVVLSNNFLNSVWGKLEFRTAHTEAISEGRARVIVVIYEDLDENKLDNELKSYLKTNTYVKWGDKYFWNKLKYALPHSRNKFYERNKKQAKVMLKIDEKFDLVKNPPSPTNTSTPPITLDPSLLESKELQIDLCGKIDGEHPLLTVKV